MPVLFCLVWFGLVFSRYLNFTITICTNNTGVHAMITVVTTPWITATETFIQRTVWTSTRYETQPYLTCPLSEHSSSNRLCIPIGQSKLSAYYHCIRLTPAVMTYSTPGVIEIDFNSTFTFTGPTNKANWCTFCVMNLEINIIHICQDQIDWK